MSYKKCRGKACTSLIFSSGLCEKHYKNKLRRWKERSQYRLSLGLCNRCTKPKVKGKQSCEFHVQAFRVSSQIRREIKCKLRGWKLERVKV